MPHSRSHSSRPVAAKADTNDCVYNSKASNYMVNGGEMQGKRVEAGGRGLATVN